MKNFFPNKTALYALIAACLVVCATMGVRQTFGLYSSEFTKDITDDFFLLLIIIENRPVAPE